MARASQLGTGNMERDIPNPYHSKNCWLKYIFSPTEPQKLSDLATGVACDAWSTVNRTMLPTVKGHNRELLGLEERSGHPSC